MGAHRSKLAAGSLAGLVLAVALPGVSDVARGEPSCDNPTGLGGAPPGIDEQCRDANRTVSGKEHKERVYWGQIAGAPYPETEEAEGSFTPAEADLFTVRFRNARQGFAAGAVCSSAVPPEELEGCPRVPVIYGTDEDNPWREIYRSEEPGY